MRGRAVAGARGGEADTQGGRTCTVALRYIGTQVLMYSGIEVLRYSCACVYGYSGTHVLRYKGIHVPVLDGKWFVNLGREKGKGRKKILSSGK